MAATARERLSSIEELFAAAKELPTHQRAAFLKERCGDDAALRSEVAELLDLDLEDPGFLEQAADPFPDPFIGRRIDRWRVVRRLGAGGMGVVYLATRDDGLFEQQVAVKLLKSGVERTELLDRFRRERQVLASLAHVNIARLIDGGATPEGVPYFVMEYVAGTRLDTWCEQQELPLEQRLALFRDVCGAVQFAHQNLVVHRDLKPSNVLVTDEGVVKLLDFGIAKVLDPGTSVQEATRTVERRLTPEYASPEVVRGGVVTTASDVFSLGVVLYELLTGTRPWRSSEQSPTDLERAICDTPATRPSAHRSELRGDLDAIVLTALAAEPRRRYGSVERLAADVERHLAHQPIVARPPGAGYLLSRFVRRNRVLVASAFVVLLALVAGAAGLISGNAKARRHAESTGRVNRLLREMLVQLEPTSARGFSQSLLKQLQYADAELKSGLLRDDPEIEVDLRMAIGRVYGGLGYAGYARAELELAHQLADRVLSPRDPRRVQILRWIGWAERNSARYPEAAARLRAAIALALEIGAGVEEDLGVARTELGLTLTSLARFDEADAVLKEAAAVETASGRSEGVPIAGIHTAIALNDLARGDPAAAEPAARASIRLCEKNFPDADPRYAMALDTLARVHQARGELDEAEPLLERSLEIRRELFDPSSPVIAWSLGLLADVQATAGRPSEAVPLLEEALAIRMRSYDLGSLPQVQTMLQLGLALADAGEDAAALRHLREAVATADKYGHSQEPLLRRGRQELQRLRAAVEAESRE